MRQRASYCAPRERGASAGCISCSSRSAVQRRMTLLPDPDTSHACVRGCCSSVPVSLVRRTELVGRGVDLIPGSALEQRISGAEHVLPCTPQSMPSWPLPARDRASIDSFQGAGFWRPGAEHQARN